MVVQFKTGYGAAARQAEETLVREMEQLSRNHASAKARRDEAKHEYWRLQDRLQSITHKIETSIGPGSPIVARTPLLAQTPPRPVASQSTRIGTPATKQNKHPDGHYVGTSVRARQDLLSEGFQNSIDGIAAGIEQMELAVHKVAEEAQLPSWINIYENVLNLMKSIVLTLRNRFRSKCRP